MTVEGRPYDVSADFSATPNKGRLGKPNNNNACTGREMVAVVTSSSASEFKVAVEASKTLHGCADYVVNLRLSDPNTLEGEVEGKSLPVKIVRK